MATKNLELPSIAIDAELLDRLHDKFYAVVDDFVPREFADRLLVDAERLYSENGHNNNNGINGSKGISFRQHYFRFGDALLRKPNVRAMCCAASARAVPLSTHIYTWMNFVSASS